MPKICTFLLLLFCSVSYGQTPPEKKLFFPPDEFVVYHSFTDSINNILYEVGRHEPRHHTFEPAGERQWQRIPIKNAGRFSHLYAPVYLKIQKEEAPNFYFLDDYTDADLYRIKKLNESTLLFITSRYGFHIFDPIKETLSKKIIPGLNQYESEDALDGLYDGMELFDSDRFLLGNVKGYGIFCLDITNVSCPIALKQYGKAGLANGQFYVFFVPKNDGVYDVILAQIDRNAIHSNISEFYTKLKDIRYVVQNIAVEKDRSEELVIRQDAHQLFFRSGQVSYCIDLLKGSLIVR